MAIKVEVDDFPGRDSYLRLWPDILEQSEWFSITITKDGLVYVSARSKDATARLIVARVNFQTVMLEIQPTLTLKPPSRP